MIEIPTKNDVKYAANSFVETYYKIVNWSLKAELRKAFESGADYIKQNIKENK